MKAQAEEDGEFSSDINNGGGGEVNADVNALALDDGKASFNVEDDDNDGSGDLDAIVNDVANDGGEANLSGKLPFATVCECVTTDEYANKVAVDNDDDVALATNVQADDDGKVNINIQKY